MSGRCTPNFTPSVEQPVSLLPSPPLSIPRTHHRQSGQPYTPKITERITVTTTKSLAVQRFSLSADGCFPRCRRPRLHQTSLGVVLGQPRCDLELRRRFVVPAELLKQVRADA